MCSLNAPSDDLDPCSVIEAVYKLAPLCSSCGSKRLHLCLEASCGKSDLFCMDCSSDIHFLHRTNELKTLFLTNPKKKHYSDIVSERLGSLRNFLKDHKARSEEIIKEHRGLIDRLTRNIQEIDRLRENGKTQSKLVSAHQTIKDYLQKKIAFKPAQATFTSCVDSLNLQTDTQKQFCTFRETLAYLRLFQQSPYRKSQLNYGAIVAATISDMLSVNREFSIEKDFKLNWSGAYVHSVLDHNKSAFETNMICKSRVCHFNEVNGGFMGKRLFIEDSNNEALYYGKKIEQCPSHLEQLHTIFQFSQFPRTLKSLTFSVDKYSQNITKDIMKCFPQSLVTLRMRVSSTPSLKHSLYLTHLRNLKYFVYSDSTPTNLLLKNIMKFAIANDMRMLCILNGARYMTYNRQATWDHRIESLDMHRFPKLKRHYVVYRRKILQIHKMHRGSLGAMAMGMRELILEMVEGHLDFELEWEENNK